MSDSISDPTPIENNNHAIASENSLLTFSRQLEKKLGDVGVQVIETESSDREMEDANGDGVVATFCRKPSPEAQSIDQVLDAIRASLPGKAVAMRLASVCFARVQCNSFYADEAWAGRRIESMYSKTALAEKDVPTIATLMMIMALGSQFSSEAAHKPLGPLLYDRTMSILPKLIHRSDFECVRACLLIATYLFPIDHSGAAYTYLGLALHMAIRNKMQKHGHDEVQVRVWWTLYTFYQRARIFHGYPKTLSFDEVEVRRPHLDPELEPIIGPSNFRNQVTLIEITIMLEKVAYEIASLRKNKKACHIANLMGLRRGMVGIHEELPDLNNQKDVSLTLIRQMSLGQGQAGSEARVLNTLQRAIIRLHKRASCLEDISTSEPSHNQLRQWEMLWQQESPDFNRLDVESVHDQLNSTADPQLTLAMDPILSDRLGSFNQDHDDMWSAIFNAQLDEFSLLPAVDAVLQLSVDSEEIFYGPYHWHSRKPCGRAGVRNFRDTESTKWRSIDPLPSGTILGVTYATLFPDRIGRLILDGVIDAEQWYTGNWGGLSQTDEAVIGFTRSCWAAARDKCAFYSPNEQELARRMRNVLENLRTDSVPVTDPTATVLPMLITYEDLVFILFSAVYSPLEMFPLLAQIFAELEQRIGSTSALTIQQHSTTAVNHGGLIACMDAPERFNLSTINLWKQHIQDVNNESHWAGDAWASVPLLCRKMGIVPPISQQFHGVRSANNTNFPILFIGNTVDPITLTVGAKKMSALYPGSILLSQDSIGHTSLTAVSKCTEHYVQQYLGGVLPPTNVICEVETTSFVTKE
ncbi:hypothetical protein N0V90_002882 [Kalmusia sp. IMI 367209]|nr:hypothetical protein N0V90_002882 [Kalmusia sp. IMI 367209]